MSFKIQDLVFAYKKAKVDFYYSSNMSLETIAKYEDNLFDNLNNLLSHINNNDEAYFNNIDFLGDWTLAPKGINFDDSKKMQSEVIHSSPSEHWAHICDYGEQNSNDKPTAEFRVMAACSMDFHVLSALWILKVGEKYDKKLTDCAYGNRLRRNKKGNINKHSLGSFVPYLKPFRDWRDNGIAAMRTSLKQNKKIIALTADVNSFYHEVNPGFMLDDEFIKNVVGIELNHDEVTLNKIFINAIENWAKKTPLKKGLPVGLPASAIIANMALIEFDRLIKEHVVPLYYGRYVDDIIMVMENGSNIKAGDDFWKWLSTRSDKKIASKNDNEGSQSNNEGKEIKFKTKYLDDSKSKIVFSSKKNKIFLISGATGEIFIDALASQIQERASEWRGMPCLPKSASHVGTDLLAATQADGETADSLRKTDTLTMRRAGFALKLRDFEAYERDLTPDAWKEHRHAFLSAFAEHVMVLPKFFDLAIYLPRVVKLAVACEDFDRLYDILKALKNIYEDIKKRCTVTIKSVENSNDTSSLHKNINKWYSNTLTIISEAVISAFPPEISKNGRILWENFVKKIKNLEVKGKNPDEEGVKNLKFDESIKINQHKHLRFFSYDLGYMPFRLIGLPIGVISQRGIPARKKVNFTVLKKNLSQYLPKKIEDGCKELAKWIRFTDLPNGLVFPTRPFNISEISIIRQDVYKKEQQKAVKDVMLALRGFTPNDRVPCYDRKGVLHIPDGTPRNKHNIAVTSWKTRYDSWIAAVKRMNDPDHLRYARLNQLLNNIISEPRGCHYLIMPELSMPAHWFIRIARKLQGRGISLIAGVEYLHASKQRVSNQVWAALSHDGFGFPSFTIYCQDKQRPAIHEEQELWRLANLKMTPRTPWETPPIIEHSGFLFSFLICSELTNIKYRDALRGKIDALFIPEWNQDTEAFNSLIESSALDIHAYIIQCNDREYGDSRIRAPYKDSWMRDVLRIKGGIADYCVIGEIDVLALRQFQSCHRSPSKPFKPVPDGFKIQFNRKTLPKSDGH